MKLSESQRTLLPSATDVQFYQEHGYYISQKILSDQEIDRALEGSERFYDGIFDLPGHEALENRGQTIKLTGLRKNDYASFFDRNLFSLVRNPLLGAVAATLQKTDEIRLWHDQLLFKPVDEPGSKANVGWHTDKAYWKTCRSSNLLTGWIPFHDCTVEMGTITMIDGSHRWPDNTEDLDFFNNDLEKAEQEFATGGAKIKKVPIHLKKGQVSFHHCLTIHGSGPNQSNAPRRSIAVHLQDGANRYGKYVDKKGRQRKHGIDHLVRYQNNEPDYTDPFLCPVLFASGEYYPRTSVHPCLSEAKNAP